MNTIKKIGTLRSFGLFVILAAYIGSGISYGALYLFHISLFLITTIGAVYYLKHFQQFIDLINSNKWSIFDFLLPITIVWFCFSLLWSANVPYAINYIIYLILGCSIFFLIKLLFPKLKHLKYLILIISIGLALDVIISLIEAFTNFKWFVSIGSPYLAYFGRKSFDPSLFPGIDLENIINYSAGFHWNPNDLALIFSISFPFIFFNKSSLISIIGSIIVFLIIFNTGSRLNVLAILFGLFSISFLLKKADVLKYITLVIFMISLSTNFYSSTPSSINSFKEIQTFLAPAIPFHHFDELDIISEEEGPSLEQHSLTENADNTRKTLILDALDLWEEHMLLGVGAGNDIYYQELKGGVSEKHITSMHNFWLELMVNGGVLLLLIWIIWYARTILSLWKKRNSQNQYYYKASLISMLIFILGAISPSSCIYFLPMYILFGFVNQLLVSE